MKREYFLAALVILIWGSGPSFIKLMIGGLDNLNLTLYTNLVATLFLFVINLFTGRLRKLRELSVKEYAWLFLLGLIGMGFYNLFLFDGVARLLTQQATVINYLWPVFIVLLSCPIIHEKMTKRKAAALALSFCGVMVVATHGHIFALANMNGLGVLTCVLSAFCYGLFSVLNLKVTCDKFVAMMLYYGSSFVILLLWALLTKNPFSAITGAQFGGIFWIGAFVNGFAYTLWALALDLGDTAKISNLAFLTPVVSLVYIYFLIHEPIHSSTFLGMCLILGGIFVQHFKKEQPPADSEHS